MRIFQEWIEKSMEIIFDGIKMTGVAIFGSIIFLVLFITFPVWSIPYAVYRRMR